MTSKNKVLLTTSTLSLATITLAGFAVSKSGENALRLKANSYSCNEVILTETVNNPGNVSTIDGINIGTLVNFVEGDLTFSGWTNANYASKDGVATSAIKVGGSKTGKYAGSFVMSSPTYNFSRAIVYASGWLKDNSAKLIINGVENVIDQTLEGEEYVFKPYTFDLNSPSDTLTFENAPGGTATTKYRVCISRIVLRAHEK